MRAKNAKTIKFHACRKRQLHANADKCLLDGASHFLNLWNTSSNFFTHAFVAFLSLETARTFTVITSD